MAANEEDRALALEALETVTNPATAWKLIYSIGADLDDSAVTFHLKCNPSLSYVDLELYQELYHMAGYRSQSGSVDDSTQQE